ncbi:sel1 repeat family protein [Polynucleobacter sp. MWH-Loch1C5]|uniref:hypothetical protein n=1 Tax=Polynucleobacter sp. MWH-Loch1C5 TaxID=2689108 RepID=UPI001C0CC0C6|nr:hypothetical protein [Polynucleobacter sp. MWH-Loch1C5]MBU3542350.1 sel1 repeat family protein [Polynucleobacter sp. MWH-Loch1C5]
MASRELLKILKLARSGDVFSQHQLGRIYLLGLENTPANLPNALLWLEKASVSSSFKEEFSFFLAEHLPLVGQVPVSSLDFALRSLLLSSHSGHLRARWYVSLSLFNRLLLERDLSVDTPTLLDGVSFSRAVDIASYLSIGIHSRDDLLVMGQRYLEELADLDGEFQSSAKELLVQSLQLGLFGQQDLARAQKIQSHLATDSVSGLRHLLDLSSAFDHEPSVSLMDALRSHIPELLRLNDTSYLSLYWAAWVHLENESCLETAAELGHARARLILGLRMARFSEDELSEFSLSSVDLGLIRIPPGKNARLKQAVYWLKLAAGSGERDAWYALGLINRMPQYSGYSAEDSDTCFDKAADLGHPYAQYRKGASLWRKREQLEEKVVGLQASYWVWHAASQGVSDARVLLSKLMVSCPNAVANRWAKEALIVRESLENLSHRFSGSSDLILMAHRILVANQLDLSQAEMLLVDMLTVQHEHGAVIDIREHLPRSSPRLIQIETLEQRKTLMLAGRAYAAAFNKEIVDEGNLRQRRYRLDKLFQLLGIQ